MRLSGLEPVRPVRVGAHPLVKPAALPSLGPDTLAPLGPSAHPPGHLRLLARLWHLNSNVVICGEAGPEGALVPSFQRFPGVEVHNQMKQSRIVF